jgi:hypothetical protein
MVVQFLPITPVNPAHMADQFLPITLVNPAHMADQFLPITLVNPDHMADQFLPITPVNPVLVPITKVKKMETLLLERSSESIKKTI